MADLGGRVVRRFRGLEWLGWLGGWGGRSGQGCLEGRVVRVLSLDDTPSENIWFIWSKHRVVRINVKQYST